MADIKLFHSCKRDYTYYYDLTADQKAEVDSYYDHLDEDERMDHFIIYHDTVYHISDFMRCGYSGARSPFDPFWHAYLSDSFFSGILIHHCTDEETDNMDDQVIIATYLV